MEQQRLINTLIVLLIVSIIGCIIFYVKYRNMSKEKERSDKYFKDFLCAEPLELIILLSEKAQLLRSRDLHYYLKELFSKKLEDFFVPNNRNSIAFNNVDLILVSIDKCEDKDLKEILKDSLQITLELILQSRHELFISSLVNTIQQNSMPLLRINMLMALSIPSRISAVLAINTEIEKRLAGSCYLTDEQRSCLKSGKLTVVKKETAINV